MKLLIDSREQLPLTFNSGTFTEIVVEGLPFGDYWCEVGGKQMPLAFERKGLGDLYGTMTSGYYRFKNEMQRAKENNFTLILLIEGSMREVAKGYKHSTFSGDSMLKKLAMLRVRYDLEYHFCNDRAEMARHIAETFDAIRRNFQAPKEAPALGECGG